MTVAQLIATLQEIEDQQALVYFELTADMESGDYESVDGVSTEDDGTIHLY